ncbi:MAG: MarR family winged helix-turn-helix transcriptional regulator [Desulfobacterales bacterium]|nr:MarR family winged helix-turn-helix transcriptional regulator [Desulfobacterales bacterium]
MPTPTSPDASQISGACACFNLRKSARLVTQLYDHKLRTAGIRATQFTILVAIQAHAPIAIQSLSRIIVMDRTTLARNLKPLERKGLIAITPGTDRRVRLARLTSEGQSVLSQALPLWQAAQAEFSQKLGLANLETMLDILSQTVAAIQTG